MRDFFFDPNMHGVDWKAMRTKYEPLVPHVSHRADLTYVIGEMIGELNAGHTYVGGGDMPHPPRIPIGLLGAKLAPRFIGLLPDRQDSCRGELGPETAFAAGRTRTRRQGGRLHPRHQRPAGQRNEHSVRSARQPGRQAGDTQDQLGAEGERQPRNRHRAHRQRRRPVLSRMGDGQYQKGQRRNRRQGRLPPCARHAGQAD